MDQEEKQATSSSSEGNRGYNSFYNKQNGFWENKSQCCCGLSENRNNLNEKLGSLIENVLKKVLEKQPHDLNASVSAYEKARLQIEREKVALQEKTAKCLWDISKEIRNISSAFGRTKRRRQSGNYVVTRKRQRWKSDSDSSV